MEALIGILVLTLIFWAGVLISYRSTVKKHLYIPVITFGFIFIALFFTMPLGLIMLGSAVWMAYDLRKLEAHKYPLRGLTRPATAVLACVLLGVMVSFVLGLAGWLLWIVPFTWHLVNRCMILDGDIPQIKKYRKNHLPSAKSNRAVDQRPAQAINTPIPHSETLDGDKVKIMDVIVEDVEVEAADDEATSPYPSPPARKSGSSGFFGDESATVVKRNWWNVKYRLYAVGFIIVVVVIWAVWAVLQEQAEREAYEENWRMVQRQREIERQQADYQGRAFLQQQTQQYAQQQAQQRAQQQMEHQARQEAIRRQQAKSFQQMNDVFAQQKEAQQRQAQQEAQRWQAQQEAQQRQAQQWRDRQEAQRRSLQTRCIHCNGTGFEGSFNCTFCNGTGRR